MERAKPGSMQESSSHCTPQLLMIPIIDAASDPSRNLLVVLRWQIRQQVLMGISPELLDLGNTLYGIDAWKFEVHSWRFILVPWRAETQNDCHFSFVNDE